MIQSLQDSTKAIKREKFTAIQIYLRKQEKSEMNNQTLQIKEPEKEQSPKLVEGKK